MKNHIICDRNIYIFVINRVILKSVVRVILHILFCNAQRAETFISSQSASKKAGCLSFSQMCFLPFRHSSTLVMWSSFMLMSGKLSEKRLPDVAGYHTAMEVGRTSHSLPPFGFPRLRFSQSQWYFCLFSLRSAISLGIQ